MFRSEVDSLGHVLKTRELVDCYARRVVLCIRRYNQAATKIRPISSRVSASFRLYMASSIEAELAPNPCLALFGKYLKMNLEDTNNTSILSCRLHDKEG